MYNDLVERMANGMDMAMRESIAMLARAYLIKGSISVAVIVSRSFFRLFISIIIMYMQ